MIQPNQIYNMNSDEFIDIAMDITKQMLIAYDEKKYRDMDLGESDLQVVWFAHELGNKKCTIWGPAMETLYAEITYNHDKDEIYSDLYEKTMNWKFNRMDGRLVHTKEEYKDE